MYSNPDLDVKSTAGTTLSQHVYKTFGLMFLGLLVTFITSYVFYQTNLVYYLAGSFLLTIVLIVAQLGVVVSLVGKLHKMSVSSARTMFLAYSVLTGISFSTLGLMYDATDIYLAFGITAVFFGSLSVIGFTTKINMGKFVPILFVGLIALVGVQLMSLFFNLSGMTRLICSAGILIFMGITIYDVQKMKGLYMANQGDEVTLKRLSIYSAFELYLDFINIFIYILRLLGSRD